MRARSSSLLLKLVPVFGLAMVTAACIPLPIPHSELVTPQVAGTLEDSNGLPARGSLVALTPSEHDTLCTQPTIQQRTDDQGRFQAGATERHKTILLLTLMEDFGYRSYWLCSTAADSTGKVLYRARTYRLDRNGASLRCLTWVWQDRPRITCNSSNAPNDRIIEGGHWVLGATEGTYRVILGGEGAWGYPTHAFIQWLARPTPRTPERVKAALDSLAAMVELPEEVNIGETPTVSLRQDFGQWLLIVRSTKRTFWGRARSLIYRLGPPGEAVLTALR